MDVVVGVRDELVYLHLGRGGQRPIPYLRGWELQRQLHGQRVDNEIPGTCVLLQTDMVGAHAQAGPARSCSPPAP